MAEKIILPVEVKVCGTCTYWDGDRKVDDDTGVVVVGSDCEGECLVQEAPKPALHDTRREADCEWDGAADVGEEQA